MNLTPMDIRKQHFKKSMRGYDPVEVDTFMEMVAHEVEGLLKQLNEHREKALESDTQLRDYRQIEKTLQQTLLQAQEVTGKTYENARQEAALILKDAESRASTMIADSTDRLSRMSRDVQALKTHRARIVARLRALLTAELELLDALPDPEDAAPEDGNAAHASRENVRTQEQH